MRSSVELDVLQHVVTMTTDDVSGRLLLCTNSADVVDSWVIAVENGWVSLSVHVGSVVVLQSILFSCRQHSQPKQRPPSLSLPPSILAVVLGLNQQCLSIRCVIIAVAGNHSGRKLDYWRVKNVKMSKYYYGNKLIIFSFVYLAGPLSSKCTWNCWPSVKRCSRDCH